MAGRAAALEYGFLGAEAGLGRGRGGGRRGRGGGRGLITSEPVLADEPPKFGLDGGDGLRRYLLREFELGRLTSEAVCTLSWHASRAGAARVADLGLDPKSHKQAEHLRKAMDVRSPESFYTAKIPLWNKVDEERMLHDFPMYLPHEAFGKSFARDPKAFDPAENDGLYIPPSFFSHEVYESKGAKACPIGYFSDGVPHTNRDSFFAFYWSSIFSGERFMICSLRKQDLCQCGCRGFCTLSAVMKTIAWSFNQLAGGIYPEVGHDGCAFPEGSTRAELAGTFIADGMCGAVVEMRADLLEIIGALGFTQSWSTKSSPCFLCDVEHEHLYDFPVDMCHHDWPLRDMKAYDRKARSAVIVREVATNEVLMELAVLLQYDARKKDGYGPGLLLVRDYPELNLPAGARIMESDDLSDIHHLSKLRAPVTLKFFDSQGDHGLTFISPLFDIIGFSIECIALDVMHVMDLGVSQYLVGSVLRELMESNFCGSTQMNVAARRFDNLKAIRRRLTLYYQDHERSRGTMSAIGRLTLPMLGSMKVPHLKSKAAECRNLVPLTVMLCAENPGLGGDGAFHLRTCCRELDSFYAVMKAEPRHMSQMGLRQLQRHIGSFLVHWKAYGGHLVFKHHAAWHLAERAARHGNPKYYWTYADEQENRVMGTVAKKLHGGRTFYQTFLQRILPEHA